MRKETNSKQSWVNPGAPSLQSRALTLLLRIIRFKQRKNSIYALKKRLRKLKLKPASYLPKGLGKGIDFRLKTIEGWPVYYVSESTVADPSDFVIFLHGGGYVDEIVQSHWQFVTKMVKKAKICCIVPIYPLAPAAIAKDVVPTLGKLMSTFDKDIGLSRLSIVGNSVGAGLALAVTQWLRDINLTLPAKLILISPALQASSISLEQRAIAKIDPFLDIEGYLEGLRLYADELSLAHPYVSPLYGNLYGLPPITIFSGTLDFLYPDSIDLVKKAESAGVIADLYLKKEQPHNYVLMPIPEAAVALNIIVNEIRLNSPDRS